MKHPTANQLHAIRQCQGLTMALVAGAAADTNIAISGIGVKDEIVAVLENAAGVFTDRTGVTSVTSAGNIQCTVDTTGDQLVVFYMPWVGSTA